MTNLSASESESALSRRTLLFLVVLVTISFSNILLLVEMGKLEFKRFVFTPFKKSLPSGRPLETEAETQAVIDRLEPVMLERGVTRDSSRYLPPIVQFWGPTERYFSDARVASLCNAIAANDVRQIEKLLASGVDVNATGPGGTTPLLWAFAYNKIEAFRVLLEHGASPDAKFTDYIDCGSFYAPQFHTVLALATLRPRRVEYFQAALKYTKNVDQELDEGDNLVIAFLKYQRWAVIGSENSEPYKAKDLVMKGANVNFQNAEGNTALHAAYFAHKIGNFLLDHGADPMIPNKSGQTAADLIFAHDSKDAAYLEFRERVAQLLKKVGAEAGDNE